MAFNIHQIYGRSSRKPRPSVCDLDEVPRALSDLWLALVQVCGVVIPVLTIFRLEEFDLQI